MPTKIDWVLASCYYYCFLCGRELPPPDSKNGNIHYSTTIEIIMDKEGNISESEERICFDCCYCSYKADNLGGYSVNKR